MSYKCEINVVFGNETENEWTAFLCEMVENNSLLNGLDNDIRIRMDTSKNFAIYVNRKFTIA